MRHHLAVKHRGSPHCSTPPIVLPALVLSACLGQITAQTPRDAPWPADRADPVPLATSPSDARVSLFEWTRSDSLALAALEEKHAEPSDSFWPAFQACLGGAFLGNFNTEFRLSANNANAGTDVDFERDLGFDSSANLFRADAYYRFNRHHRINFSYFDIRRDSSKRLQRDIQWGDETYPVDATVSAFFDTKVVKLSYQWTFLPYDTWELGVSIGFHWIRLSTGIAAGNLALSTEFVQNAPFPVIGLHGEWHVAKHVRLVGYGDFLSVHLENVGSLQKLDRYLIDAMVGVEADVLGPVGLGLGYNFFDLNATVANDNFSLQGNYRYQGLLLYGTVSF